MERTSATKPVKESQGLNSTFLLVTGIALGAIGTYGLMKLHNTNPQTAALAVGKITGLPLERMAFGNTEMGALSLATIATGAGLIGKGLDGAYDGEER